MRIAGVLPTSGALRDANLSIAQRIATLYGAGARTFLVWGRDLWVSTRDTVFDLWSGPLNLGSLVNGVANELTPFLSSDGRQLFFASDRIVPDQVGAADLYVTKRDKPGAFKK